MIKVNHTALTGEALSPSLMVVGGLYEFHYINSNSVRLGTIVSTDEGNRFICLGNFRGPDKDMVGGVWKGPLSKLAGKFYPASPSIRVTIQN